MATHTNKTSFKKSKNRKHKIELVFDEEKRRDFLSGFRKRKLERKKKAQEKLATELREEKKKLKREARESYKKMVASHGSIPEIENLLTEEYEKEDATVKVTELSTSEIAKINNWIGENKPVYEDKSDSDISDSVDETMNDNIPGMELKPKVDNKAKLDTQEPKYKTKKEIKKALRKEATKKVQKSKAYQLKNKLEQQKSRRKTIKLKKEEDRLQKKKRKPNKFKNSRKS